MKKVLLLLVTIITITSCGIWGPTAFVKSSEVNWSNIQIRDGIDQNEAWIKTVDILSTKYEIEFIDNESKYIRTGWIHGFDGVKGYLARATIKFSLDGKIVKIKSEAKFSKLVGYDQKLLSTLKTDIGGVLGRVTR